jgi:paraquat-inducible protein B
MNAADQAIEEIREVRRRISAEFDHDITKYLAHLREEEKQHQEQIQRGKELLAQRAAERQKYPEKTDNDLALREKPKS